MTKKTISLVTAGVLLSCWSSWAVVFPSEVRNLAPECVTLRIVASQKESFPFGTKVSLAAEVVEVFKTATDLEPGDYILVTYQQDHARVEKEMARREMQEALVVGPQVMTYPPVLNNGDLRVAYLEKVKGENSSGHVYTPDAHQYSFLLKEEMKRDD